MNLTIRKATVTDINAVTEIYNMIHRLEREGKVAIGWDADSYPVMETAKNAFDDDSLYVMTTGNIVVASAIINQIQPEAYALRDW